MVFVYCDFVAGCIGGACGILVGHPLDTIKTWQQAGNARIARSIFDIIVRNNGLNGFYRGMMFPLLSSGTLYSIFFGIYGNELRRLQALCNSDRERRQKWRQQVFIAGSEAGFIQSLIACPVELIKIRLQTQNYYDDYRYGKQRGPIDCIKRIYLNEGIIGFYRGFAPMICRDVFPYGIYMLTYDYINKRLTDLEWFGVKRKNQMVRKFPNDSLAEMSITIASGAIAGIMSWILVIPFDVMKTIIQAECGPNRYQNMRKFLKTNIKIYGWRILFRGSGILLFRSIPTNAATFLGYEYALHKCHLLSN